MEKKFTIYIKPKGIYVDIAKYVETRFDTSNCELEGQLFKWKNKEVIGLMKDELSGKLKTEITALKPKTYIYLTDDDDEKKQQQKAQKNVIEHKFKFEDYKHCLEAIQLENKINYLEKINFMYTVLEKITKNPSKIMN